MPRVGPPPAPPRQTAPGEGGTSACHPEAQAHRTRPCLMARAPKDLACATFQPGRGSEHPSLKRVCGRPLPRPLPARYCCARGETSIGVRRVPRMLREPPAPGPLPPLRRGGGDLNCASAGIRALDCACSPRRRTLGRCCRDAATSVAPAGQRSPPCRPPHRHPKCAPSLPRCLWERVARVSARPGEGPTVAEASASVTAAAPGLVRAPGWILRPASGVLRANAARLGLRMTSCGERKIYKARHTGSLPPRLFAGEGLGMGGARPSTTLDLDPPEFEVVSLSHRLASSYG
jgi:hypothetical protein